MKKAMMAAGAAVLLTACGATADTSSPQAFAASVERMSKGLTDARKAQLHDALVAIAFDAADPGSTMFAQAPLTSPLFMAAGDRVKGRTADQIIRLGYETRIQLLDKDLAKDAAGIQSAKAARAKLANVFDNVRIDRVRYYVDHSNSFMDQPVVALHVANDSRMPIKRIYMHGVLSSPGRSIPWVDEDINYEFEGGLEPGEDQSLNLEPNSFGDWAPKDTFASRSDLVLKLQVTNLEGADGRQLVNDDLDPAALQADAAEKQKLRDRLAAEMAKS